MVGVAGRVESRIQSAWGDQGYATSRRDRAGRRIRAPYLSPTPPCTLGKGRTLMSRDQERLQRSQEEPIVGGLPDVPGILAAIRLTPGLGVHLRGLADELLVNDFPGATLVRAEREMLATAVSAANDCFYCMDSHGAFANALLERD